MVKLGNVLRIDVDTVKELARQNLETIKGIPEGVHLYVTDEDCRKLGNALLVSHLAHIVGSASGTAAGAAVAASMGLPAVVIAPAAGILAASGAQMLWQFAVYARQPDIAGKTDKEKFEGYARLQVKTAMLAPAGAIMSGALNAALIGIGLPPVISGVLSPTPGAAVNMPATLHAYNEEKTPESLDAILVVRRGESGKPAYAPGLQSYTADLRNYKDKATFEIESGAMPEYFLKRPLDFTAAAIYFGPMLRENIKPGSHIGVVIEKSGWNRTRSVLEDTIGRDYHYVPLLTDGKASVPEVLQGWASNAGFAWDYAKSAIKPDAFYDIIRYFARK